MLPKSIRGRAAAGLAGMIALASITFGQGLAPVAAPVAIPVASAEAVGGQGPSVNYRLRPKDSVHIKVFEEEDLETTARIDVDGDIFFPLLGKARIGGETQQEATATMESLLREYLIHPQVSLEIVSYAKQHFTILGQVNKPGIYDIPDESSLNLLEAIGMAGGFTKIANPSKVIVKRTVNGQETTINIDAKQFLKKQNTGETIPQVLSGDTINIGEAIF